MIKEASKKDEIGAMIGGLCMTISRAVWKETEKKIDYDVSTAERKLFINSANMEF